MANDRTRRNPVAGPQETRTQIGPSVGLEPSRRVATTVPSPSGMGSLKNSLSGFFNVGHNLIQIGAAEAKQEDIEAAEQAQVDATNGDEKDARFAGLRSYERAFRKTKATSWAATDATTFANDVLPTLGLTDDPNAALQGAIQEKVKGMADPKLAGEYTLAMTEALRPVISKHRTGLTAAFKQQQISEWEQGLGARIAGLNTMAEVDAIVSERIALNDGAPGLSNGDNARAAELKAKGYDAVFTALLNNRDYAKLQRMMHEGEPGQTWADRFGEAYAQWDKKIVEHEAAIHGKEERDSIIAVDELLDAVETKADPAAGPKAFAQYTAHVKRYGDRSTMAQGLRQRMMKLIGSEAAMNATLGKLKVAASSDRVAGAGALSDKEIDTHGEAAAMQMVNEREIAHPAVAYKRWGRIPDSVQEKDRRALSGTNIDQYESSLLGRSELYKLGDGLWQQGLSPAQKHMVVAYVEEQRITGQVPREITTRFMEHNWTDDGWEKVNLPKLTGQTPEDFQKSLRKELNGHFAKQHQNWFQRNNPFGDDVVVTDRIVGMIENAAQRHFMFEEGRGIRDPKAAVQFAIKSLGHKFVALDNGDGRKVIHYDDSPDVVPVIGADGKQAKTGQPVEIGGTGVVPATRPAVKWRPTANRLGEMQDPNEHLARDTKAILGKAPWLGEGLTAVPWRDFTKTGALTFVDPETSRPIVFPRPGEKITHSVTEYSSEADPVVGSVPTTRFIQTEVPSDPQAYREWVAKTLEGTNMHLSVLDAATGTMTLNYSFNPDSSIPTDTEVEQRLRDKASTPLAKFQAERAEKNASIQPVKSFTKGLPTPEDFKEVVDYLSAAANSVSQGIAKEVSKVLGDPTNGFERIKLDTDGLLNDLISRIKEDPDKALARLDKTLSQSRAQLVEKVKSWFPGNTEAQDEAVIRISDGFTASVKAVAEGVERVGMNELSSEIGAQVGRYVETLKTEGLLPASTGVTKPLKRLFRSPQDGMNYVESLVRDAQQKASETLEPLSKTANRFNDRLYSFVASLEGKRLSVYDDETGKTVKAGDEVRGLRTVGIGFNMDDPRARHVWQALGISKDFDAVLRGEASITDDEAKMLHDYKSREAELWVRKQFGQYLQTDNQVMALTSMVFNSRWKDGRPTLMGPRITAAIKSGDWDAAEEEIRYRSNHGGNRGLAVRRQREANLFMSGLS